ncbi:aminotransferase class V-fold PLP-dependent enzyme [Rhodocytophaga aerolata]|uniref:phosphoserine transaminase n=1 Tax=Rhodocytophaga aerolata TaxID=455078 RepID=A0ABT8R4M7_9BACT|nr:aminotransferase class V-fold PLP-dependent enzyme [Rhodocytophaga aerolata]MDO1447047.1 aminotransferase class V-fold PLP-dependent enzyme [Rhodocytophaga aerolata]
MAITFYPGPSKVYPQVAHYMQDAYTQGILSVNHRSAVFMDVCQRSIELLKEKLHIPADYSVMYVSSATESWEIIAQSLVEKHSYHLYNGAFGAKWREYSAKLRSKSEGYAFGLNEELQADAVYIPSEAEILCFTQNETSNGTQVNNTTLANFSKGYSDKLIAVDATSSLGGITLDFTLADIWFASVQKCLGLPAGLGLLVCSPRALKRARQLGENDHYNSLLFIQENIERYQTHYTPNVLSIYLLMRVMENVDEIGMLSNRIKQQAADWYTFFHGREDMKPLVGNPGVRSDTVITIQADPVLIGQLKEKAKQEGITLGNGYGAWKQNTFRIANFPAITTEEIHTLQAFLNRQIE